ncbi:N-acetylmuramoyl-L-alanine amidase [Aureimonas ureilytica]|uniref:N-acetylmuramoyl-L-alanine amidase n=1 Tax=Aureimonas ureilytica TaxID=401562 RepID=UPI0009E88622|nr:N-acetylmuramoyl-L-alanine amidase [Aureimonas ureilytica]
MSIPKSWLPAATMARVILHWTGGAHVASTLDRQHYHLIVEGDGNLVRGDLPISANQAPIRGNYAAHTLGCNSGSIGLSLCSMAGATESPFNPGQQPTTAEQWKAGVEIIAELCRTYSIPVTPETVLTHAEVQGNLGIKQRGKWDIARLAFDPAVFGARVVGDRLRREVQAVLDGKRAAPAVLEPAGQPSAPAAKEMELTATVTAPRLNLRRAPDGEIVGSLPRGARLAVLDHDRGWSEVRTPAGHLGFVASQYLTLDA